MPQILKKSQEQDILRFWYDQNIYFIALWWPITKKTVWNMCFCTEITTIITIRWVCNHKSLNTMQADSSSNYQPKPCSLHWPLTQYTGRQPYLWNPLCQNHQCPSLWWHPAQRCKWSDKIHQMLWTFPIKVAEGFIPFLLWYHLSSWQG